MAEPKSLPAANLRAFEPLPLLLEWHDARGREREPMQSDLLTELMRRLRREETMPTDSRPRRLDDLIVRK